MDLDGFDLGVHYGFVRERISALVAEIEEPAGLPVPACPKWSVHDVVAHLTAVVEDVLAGRLTGPPSEEDTAAQVARRKGMPTAQVLAEWAEMAPPFESLLSDVRVWPGFLDVLAHEHDVRGAVSVPGGRDTYEMRAASEWLLSVWQPAVMVRVRIGEREHIAGARDRRAGDPHDHAVRSVPVPSGSPQPCTVACDGLDGDPTPVLEGMTIFGPEPYDIVE